MAQARDRRMGAEFLQGTIDNTYIQLAPNRGGLVEIPHLIDRAANDAPYQYLNVEVHGDDPFAVARARRAEQPVEVISRYKPRRDDVSMPSGEGGLV